MTLVSTDERDLMSKKKARTTKKLTATNEELKKLSPLCGAS